MAIQVQAEFQVAQVSLAALVGVALVVVQDLVELLVYRAALALAVIAEFQVVLDSLVVLAQVVLADIQDYQVVQDLVALLDCQDVQAFLEFLDFQD